jgi:hypothetical protein
MFMHPIFLSGQAHEKHRTLMLEVARARLKKQRPARGR